MDRVEKFLSSLVQKPETWVRITTPKKKKGINRDKQKLIKDRRVQRDEILNQVKQTLDLMGIPYEVKWHGPYTLRVLR